MRQTEIMQLELRVGSLESLCELQQNTIEILKNHVRHLMLFHDAQLKDSNLKEDNRPSPKTPCPKCNGRPITVAVESKFFTFKCANSHEWTQPRKFGGDTYEGTTNP